MPSAPLEKIELPRIRLPVLLKPLNEWIATPAALLNAITLPSPALDPPIELASEAPERPSVMSIPGPVLGTVSVPVTSVPMKLPWTTFMEDAFEMPTPKAEFPEMRLRAAAVLPPIVLFPGCD